MRRVGRALIVAVPLAWGSTFFVGYVPALWAVTAMGLALTIVGLRRAPLGLLGASMLACLDAPSRVFLFTGGLFRWSTFGFLLVFATVIYFRSMRAVWSAQFGLLLGFTGLLVVQLLFSPDRRSGIEHLLGLSAIFGFLGFCLAGGRHPQHWFWVARVTGVLAAVGSPVFFRVRDGLDYINPNAFAYLPVTALLLAAVVSNLVPVRDRRGFLLPLCVAANLTWTFLSGSRGSFLVGAIASAFFTLSWGRRLRARIALTVACGVAIAVAGLFADLESGMTSRLEKSFEEERSLSNRTSGRSDIAIVGWRMFLDHPLGVGTGGFQVVAPRYGRMANLDVFKGHEELQAHSAWVKILGENGVPGMMLFVAFLGSFGVVGWQRRRHGVAGLGFIVSAILAIAFLSTEFQAKGLWLFAAGGLVGVRLLRQSERSAAPRRASSRRDRAIA